MTVLDPRGVAGTSPDRIIRQSTLGSFDVCHKRVEFDRDPNIGYGTGPHRAFGTAYHAGLEAYYEGMRTGLEGNPLPSRTITEAVGEAFTRESQHISTWEPDWTSANEAVGHVLHLVLEYITKDGGTYWLFDHDVVATEVTLFYPLGDTGWAMKGTLDLVLRNRDTGAHVIVDHKTARRPWKKGKELFKNTNQPAWYTLFWPLVWAEANGGEVVDTSFWFDVMSHDGRLEHRQAPVTEAQRAAVLEKASAACRLIDNGGPYLPNTQSFLCSKQWCDHWDRCPFGAAVSNP